jgi:hypothetical protein
LNPRNTREGRGRGLGAPTAIAAAALTFGTALILLAALAVPGFSELVQKGPLRVSVTGKIAPHSLPRNGVAPVAVSVGGKISSTQPGGPPQLRRITIGINRHGTLDSEGLPVCRVRQIQPSTDQQAFEACGASLVGEGHFSADIKIPSQSPFPSDGRIMAFNGRLGGKPAILAHIYGAKPLPTSYVLPFAIHRSRGTFGTVLEASLPNVTGEWGFVKGVEMTLSRQFRFHGARRSYLSAGCPAAEGFRSAFFDLAKTSFSFAGGVTLSSLLSRRCTVSH